MPRFLPLRLADAVNAADDRQLQLGERSYRHVAAKSECQAAERHSKLWVYRRAVYRENWHVDSGQYHSWVSS